MPFRNLKEWFNKKSWLKKALVLIFVFNVAAYAHSLQDAMVGRPYPVAKFYMGSAEYVNNYFVFPLGALFKGQTILSYPFYRLSDSLYEEGLKHLPKDELEREYWWHIIRESHYSFLYLPRLPMAKEGISQRRFEKYARWKSDFYNHLKRMSSLKKLKDPKFEEKPHKFFADDAAAFFTLTWQLGCLASNRNEQCVSKLDDPNMNPVIVNMQEIQRLKDTIDWYISLKKPASYLEGYYTFNEFFFLIRSAELIALHRISIEKSSCNGHYEKIYQKSREKLLSFFKLDEKERLMNKQARIKLSFFNMYEETGFLSKFMKDYCDWSVK